MSTFTIQGPWRTPRNTSADEKGGIHDDATAQNLGFSGGTVAGSIHMEQFPPFLLEHLGEAWLETGCLSLYFRSATTDGDPVQCVAESSVKTQFGQRMQLGMIDKQGTVVMDGTASVGTDPDSALRQKLRDVRVASDIRVLADVQVNEWSQTEIVRIPTQGIDRQLQVITEPMAMFGKPGDSEGRVPPLSTLIHAMRDVEKTIVRSRGEFVGLFGAIEIAYYGGQPVTGKDYALKGRALAVADSPKTEIFWMESVLMDVERKEPVVTMIKMDRVMKASSPLWADQA